MNKRASAQQPLDELSEADSIAADLVPSEGRTPNAQGPRPNAQGNPQRPTPGLRSANAKILVADDSAVVAAMLTNILRGEGYQTVRAADGIEATQRAYSEMPDLILL